MAGGFAEVYLPFSTAKFFNETYIDDDDDDDKQDYTCFCSIDECGYVLISSRAN